MRVRAKFQGGYNRRVSLRRRCRLRNRINFLYVFESSEVDGVSHRVSRVPDAPGPRRIRTRRHWVPDVPFVGYSLPFLPVLVFVVLVFPVDCRTAESCYRPSVSSPESWDDRSNWKLIKINRNETGLVLFSSLMMVQVSCWDSTGFFCLLYVFTLLYSFWFTMTSHRKYSIQF